MGLETTFDQAERSRLAWGWSSLQWMLPVNQGNTPFAYVRAPGMLAISVHSLRYDNLDKVYLDVQMGNKSLVVVPTEAEADEILHFPLEHVEQELLITLRASDTREFLGEGSIPLSKTIRNSREPEDFLVTLLDAHNAAVGLVLCQAQLFLPTKVQAVPEASMPPCWGIHPKWQSVQGKAGGQYMPLGVRRFLEYAGLHRVAKTWQDSVLSDRNYGTSFGPCLKDPGCPRMKVVYGINVKTERCYFFQARTYRSQVCRDTLPLTVCNKGLPRQRSELSEASMQTVFSDTTSLSTKVPALYRSQGNLMGHVVLDANGTLPDLGEGGGTCHELPTTKWSRDGLERKVSGDGQVPYASLQFPIQWRDDGANVELHEIEGADHCGILNNQILHELLLVHVAAVPPLFVCLCIHRLHWSHRAKNPPKDIICKLTFRGRTFSTQKLKKDQEAAVNSCEWLLVGLEDGVDSLPEVLPKVSVWSFEEGQGPGMCLGDVHLPWQTIWGCRKPVLTRLPLDTSNAVLKHDGRLEISYQVQVSVKG